MRATRSFEYAASRAAVDEHNPFEAQAQRGPCIPDIDAEKSEPEIERDQCGNEIMDTSGPVQLKHREPSEAPSYDPAPYTSRERGPEDDVKRDREFGY